MAERKVSDFEFEVDRPERYDMSGLINHRNSLLKDIERLDALIARARELGVVERAETTEEPTR